MANVASTNTGAGTGASSSAVSGGMSLQQYNDAARQQLIKNSILKKQLIYTFTGDPASINNIINIGGNFVRMAGLLTRFIVEVTATFAEIANGATTVVTDIGAPNLLSNIQFTDLQNNQRHNSSGVHFNLVSTMKRHYPWGTAFTAGQSFAANQIGANVPLAYATPPTNIATGSARCVYEIPVAISRKDLRGSIFLGVYGAQLSLQLQINPNPAPEAGDSTFAVFYDPNGAGESSISSVTVNVYQEYYDQLPTNNGAFVLPPLDISTVYQLTYTNFTNFTTGQDYYIPYANYRKYLSQNFIYNNSGTDGGLTDNGSDISYIAQVAANFTNIWKVAPLELKRTMREEMMTDLFNGLYINKTYEKPIDTQNYGNMQLDINPITAGGSSYAYVMSEFIAYQNQISQAPSLPANK
jgi:hypothetical protein